MRLSLFNLVILACMVALVAAWSKEDQEIFSLKDEIEASEGEGTSFYDALGIERSASHEDIGKAWKKISKTLHPDKVKRQFVAERSTGKDKPKGSKKKPGVHVSKGPTQAEIKAIEKAANERYARLGVAKKVLEGEGRDRYNHFLDNGFPKWKGTGYYYARFRPGLGSVLVGLFVFIGGFGHYLAISMDRKNHRYMVERYIKHARHAALGDNLGIGNLGGTDAPAGDNAPAPAQQVNRRQRRAQEKDAKKGKEEKKGKKDKSAKATPSGTPPIGSTGPRRRVVAENGKVLIVDVVGNVYLEQADEEGNIQEFLLDSNQFPQPTIRDTALVRLPVWAFHKVTDRFLKKDLEEEYFEEEEEEAASSSSGADDFEVLEKVKTSSINGNGKAVQRKKKTSKR